MASSATPPLSPLYQTPSLGQTLCDMFYEGLKPKIKNTMLLQDFNPLDPTTTFDVLTDQALRITQ
jgi:hypothetical protein